MVEDLGISDLKALLTSMNPKIIKGEYVFCTMSEAESSSSRVNPISVFHEEEGISLILKKEEAERYSIPFSSIWARITLKVHSSLLAVGFLAVITDKLAKAGISVNVVSAYYHDHLFVPLEKADEVMSLLMSLVEGSSED
jgi:hypothetical protein